MYKGQMIEALLKDKKNGFETKAAAQRALEAVVDLIKTGVKKDPVQLIGFGTFSVRKRKARTGRNPSTGKKMKIKAKNVVHFKASKNWKV